MQQVLDCLLRQIDSGEVAFEPDTEAGNRLSDFLNDMTRKIGARLAHGVSQSSIVAATEASLSVVRPGEAETRIAGLEAARRQVALKVERYVGRRNVDRQVVVFTGGVEMTINNNDFRDANITNSTVMIAERIDHVRVGIQSSGASDQLKTALTTLQGQVKQLVAQLPDDGLKKEVATALEMLATEAAKPEPAEFLVLAAGNLLIRAGTKVKELAEPIAGTVAMVFKLLRLAAPGL